MYTPFFSLCTHKKFRPVRTMYAVKISGTLLTVFDFMRTQIKIPLKLKQTGNFQVVLSGCSVNNRKVVNHIYAAFDGSILHIMQYIMYLQ